MPAVDPFRAPGRWYRVCLHAHTTNSDGLMPPESLVRHYRTAGFDALAITDHWHITDLAERSTDDFLVLPGVEYNARGSEAGRLRQFHVVGVGTRQLADGANAPPAFVDAIHADGGVAIVAHPSWSGLDPADLLSVPGADAVEVWNAGCELEVARGDSSPQWDVALARGAVLGGVAADDSHYPGFDSAFSWVVARLTSLTPEDVLGALRERRYYASTGPVLHAVEVEGDVARVACSPVHRINVIGPPPFGTGLVAGRMGLAHRATRRRLEDAWTEGTLDDAHLAGGTFSLSAGMTWLRVVVKDALGRQAWSNPLWRTRNGWEAEPG